MFILGSSEGGGGHLVNCNYKLKSFPKFDRGKGNRWLGKIPKFYCFYYLGGFPNYWDKKASQTKLGIHISYVWMITKVGYASVKWTSWLISWTYSLDHNKNLYVFFHISPFLYNDLSVIFLVINLPMGVYLNKANQTRSPWPPPPKYKSNLVYRKRNLLKKVFGW